MKFQAQWIWLKQQDTVVYNQTIIAQKTFRLGAVRKAVCRITADSYYRLYINGQWVNDGPCRCWPEHYQYDEMDVSFYLRPGPNEIKVIARYYGVGDFHRVCQQPGLLAQLDIKSGGEAMMVGTDATWEVAEAKAWLSNTPKVSIQMEPFEYYDARREGNLKFTRAQVVCAANKGPWKDLQPRDVALLTKTPVNLSAFVASHVVRTEGFSFCVPVSRLALPGLIEANGNTSTAVGLATVITCKKPVRFQVTSPNMRPEGFRFAIDGRMPADGTFSLKPGKHILLALMKNVQTHTKEAMIKFSGIDHLDLENPLKAGDANPWCVLDFSDLCYARDDKYWLWSKDHDATLRQKVKDYQELTERLICDVTDVPQFHEVLGHRARRISADRLFVHAPYQEFLDRQVVCQGDGQVENPLALLYDTPDVTAVHPGDGGDMELVYDLGEQRCGYYQFELMAPAGVMVDIFSVEYIDPAGHIQFTQDNHNGMRYVTREGLNRFTSLKRRAGRYLFITLRNQHQPVHLRYVNLIESTYPVAYSTSFSCSDARLDKIWDISRRTLKLCMEDTFTDCPLYEQTLWVGDARNESVFAYSVFGATDLARRCIRLAGESLERFPMVGCQLPSSWACLLPAWSFLWGLSVWEYYWYTGDKAFLRDFWPLVIKNLKGAEGFLNKNSLFEGPLWNMFDWAGIDQDRKLVVHNSMFFVGAIDAAILCGQALGSKKELSALRSLRRRIVTGINRLWDSRKKAYPDSIHEDGKISPSTCQHTSFLSILYDIIERKNLPIAMGNILQPPAGMVKVGSPFAIMYLYETLEKVGREDEIIRSIFDAYLPMLNLGATTVWESFATGSLGHGSFPTRSHCHAWSATPAYFLPRIILGIKQVRPGCQEFTVSPRLNGLSWAAGSITTIHGLLSVRWERQGKSLNIVIETPQSVAVSFVANETHKGLKPKVTITRMAQKKLS